MQTRGLLKFELFQIRVSQSMVLKYDCVVMQECVMQKVFDDPVDYAQAEAADEP